MQEKQPWEKPPAHRTQAEKFLKNLNKKIKRTKEFSSLGVKVEAAIEDFSHDDYTYLASNDQDSGMREAAQYLSDQADKDSATLTRITITILGNDERSMEKAHKSITRMANTYKKVEVQGNTGPVKRTSPQGIRSLLGIKTEPQYSHEMYFSVVFKR